MSYRLNGVPSPYEIVTFMHCTSKRFCCCSLQCNRVSNWPWVADELLAYDNWLRSVHCMVGFSLISNVDLLTSLKQREYECISPFSSR